MVLLATFLLAAALFFVAFLAVFFAARFFIAIRFPLTSHPLTKRALGNLYSQHPLEATFQRTAFGPPSRNIDDSLRLL